MAPSSPEEVRCAAGTEIPAIKGAPMTSGSSRAETRDLPPQQVLEGLKAAHSGDFSTRLSRTGDPLMDGTATVFNSLHDQLALFMFEITRVAKEVGTEGKLGGQVQATTTTSPSLSTPISCSAASSARRS
jgi:hypothetical protein